MFEKTVSLLSKTGVVIFWAFAAMTGGLIGAGLSGYALHFLVANSILPPQTHPLLLVMLVLLGMVAGMILTSLGVGDRCERTMWQLDGWRKEMALRRLPTLYTYYNNGVLVVVHEEDYKAVIDRGCPLVVPNALTFSDSQNPRVKSLVTGTMEDFRRLSQGANVVKTTMHTSIYVPYTSGMMEPEHEQELFPHISFGEAERRIWRGYKRQKSAKKAA